MNFDVVLLPSFSAVDDWRRQAACAEASGLFGQTVSTFHAWICDLWDEYGDGRAIINSVQRAIFMEEAFIQTELFAHEGILDEGEACGLRSTSDSSCEPFVFSPGVVCTACECARLAFGLPAFEKTLDFAAHNDPLKQFSAGESTLLEALLKYKTLIQEEGLIELGQALAYLAEESRDFKSRSFRVLIDRAAPLDFQMNYFFEACSRIDYEVRLARGNQGIERAPEGVSIRFGCPTGPYAQAALVSDVLEQYDTDTPASTDDHTPASQGQFANSFDTIITCRDPLSFYQRMQPACKRLDVSVCVQTKKAFPLTDFGRHFLALASFQQENAAFIESLSDALLPPFSGLSQSQAYQVDVQLRSDRIIDVEAFLAVLRAQSDTFSQLEELASTPEADVLLGVFEQIVHASSKRCEAWRAEQLAAISALRAFTSAARSAGLDMSQCTHLLERFFIRLAFEQRALDGDADDADDAHNQKRVLICSQEDAAQFGARACKKLFVCDLTSEDYPVSDRGDALLSLFEKMGLHDDDTVLQRSRRCFTALQQLPEQLFVCVRPLNNYEGEPNYPAAVLQEFIDVLSLDTATATKDPLTQLPSSLMELCVQRGEEHLFANERGCAPSQHQEIAELLRCTPIQKIEEDQREKLSFSHRDRDMRTNVQSILSPSQVETYLECPYFWFAQSRVGLTDIEEGFGLLERGTFAHAVLKQFYEKFIEAGYSTVDERNKSNAKDLMRDIVDEYADQQAELTPGRRYVPVNQLEKQEIEALKLQLVNYLDFEAKFLPDFKPTYFEYSITAEDGVAYAGRPFVGTVDRIDVDEQGRAVIIDYKNSLTPTHQIAGCNFQCPGKVQARMYARACERALGLKVVAALYVSYGARPACSGAYDAHSLETSWLPEMNHKACSCSAAHAANTAHTEASKDQAIDDFSQLNFSDMLDATEEVVARAFADIEAGRVERNPLLSDVCQYCPVAMCDMRGA